jgi:hypothetical protein
MPRAPLRNDPATIKQFGRILSDSRSVFKVDIVIDCCATMSGRVCPRRRSVSASTRRGGHRAITVARLDAIGRPSSRNACDCPKGIVKAGPRSRWGSENVRPAPHRLDGDSAIEMLGRLRVAPSAIAVGESRARNAEDRSRASRSQGRMNQHFLRQLTLSHRPLAKDQLPDGTRSRKRCE